MLSDEERKAIEYLKQNSIPILRYDNFGNILSPLYYGTFEKEIILNLIEKQSKEIEELKQLKKQVEEIESTNFIKYKNYISKDKIKAKIEYYEKIDNPVGKRVLQSLLEKE